MADEVAAFVEYRRQDNDLMEPALAPQNDDPKRNHKMGMQNELEHVH